jgi:feruloyl esterase
MPRISRVKPSSPASFIPRSYARPIPSRDRKGAVVRLAIALLTCAFPAAAATNCESLTSLPLKGAMVTTAEAVVAGAFTQPGGRAGKGGNQYANLPAFCRVSATLKPSSDSEIKIEVWLPLANWNGNLESVGNGAWAGTIGYAAMATAIAAGYAAASTDTGHSGGSVMFVVGHPEKLTDFAYRAVHEMTIAAKAITAGYYGQAAKHSYFNGCSTGGRQALAEAQRFAGDYDGIIAGDPDFYATHIQAAQLFIGQIAHRNDAHSTEAGYIPPANYPALHKAALDACDALDGVKDGVIEDPTRCKFDPGVIACTGASAPSCLTPQQVETARKTYAGTRADKSTLWGLEPGSESGWASLSGPQPLGLAVDTYQYLVFNDPQWDYHMLDPVKDVAAADKAIGELMNSVDPNLKPFFSHGGKLIMYHGWADPGIPPMFSVEYFKNVVEKDGGAKKAASDIRLFMVPGMGHCAGGDGPNTFNSMAALADWVEHGKAPEQITASHSTRGQMDRTRPLCPYPQTAMYKGSGSTDEAVNFSCKAP